jgi:hypothetical protein
MNPVNASSKRRKGNAQENEPDAEVNPTGFHGVLAVPAGGFNISRSCNARAACSR